MHTVIITGANSELGFETAKKIKDATRLYQKLCAGVNSRFEDFGDKKPEFRNSLYDKQNDGDREKSLPPFLL